MLARDLGDASGKDADHAFAKNLITGILGKKDELDAIISKAAPQWPLERIAPIDRNVLRIGLYELLFGNREEVPPKVALNEAIELAKAYGGDSSGKFINGVLGAVYRDIGSPGKDDAPKEVTPIPHENLGGVFLGTLNDGAVHVALVHDAFGKWTLPKARCMAGELSDAAARRAMTEELGVSGTIRMPLGEHEYTAHEPDIGRIQRTVGYFFAHTTTLSKLECKICEGITEARWFAEHELGGLDMYSDLSPIIEAGIKAVRDI